MKKALLINMPSNIKVYSKSALKGIIAALAPLNLAELASAILAVGVDCQILDLQLSSNPYQEIETTIKSYRPQIVGLTFTSLLYQEAKDIASFIKKLDPKVYILAGGTHATIFSKEVLQASDIDLVVRGEGDYTIQEIVKGTPPENIKGITYKTTDGAIVSNPNQPLIQNLDTLPLPAWHLLDTSIYHFPRPFTKKSPAGPIMTSRGCLYACKYCSNAIFGRTYRAKSVARVIEEFELLLKSGFQEIMVLDDMFAMDLKRAKAICDEVIKRKFTFPWQIETGLRVNRVDAELFQKLKQANCYKTAFGFESGSDYILKTLNKSATIAQARAAVKWAKAAGMETVGFFMLGLPEDTKKTMDETINFACSLGLDYAKSTIFVPFPATPLFDELDRRGLIRTRDWSKYNFHTASKVYTHPHLSWETLQKYYIKFHRKFYFRPSYLIRRLIKSIKKRELFEDLKLAFNTFIKQ